MKPSSPSAENADEGQAQARTYGAGGVAVWRQAWADLVAASAQANELVRSREEHSMSATETQIGGDHYRTCKIQPVEFIEANGLAFLEGCVVKRVTRHARAGGKGRQDIEKAIHELQLLLQLRYGDE